MKRIIILGIISLLSFVNVNSQSKTWIKVLLKSTAEISQQAQSNAVRNVLLDAFLTSSKATKKAFRDMGIPPLEIQKITTRFSRKQLLELTHKMKGIQPLAMKSIISDLARNGDNGANVFIKTLVIEPKLMKSYERVFSSLSVKFRTDIAVLKAITNNTSPIILRTTNSALLGKTIEGVTYRMRIISIGGLKYQAVFPDFKDFRVFYTILPKNLFKASDEAQMKNATRYLRKKIIQNPELKKKFTQEQLHAIANSYKKIPGYTWHHKEAPTGAMELVPTDIHQAARHDGGKAFWNGGNR